MTAPAQVVTTAPGHLRAPTVRLLRAELRWIFRRPRTLVVLAVLAVIPVVVGIALTLVDPAGPPGGGPGGPGGAEDGGDSVLLSSVGSALALPVATLTMTLSMLLPLCAAMSGADALAGESAHGTLRGWLLAPVSRGRLLFVKAAGVAAFALTAVTVMAVTGIVTGLISNGTDSLVTLSGTTLSLPEALGKVAVAVGWVAVQLWAVGAVALAISAFTEHPIVVLASVLGGLVVFTVLQFLDALAWLHPFLLTDSWTALVDVLRDPMPGDALAEGALKAACYIVIGVSLAYARLATKDG
ncbi:ABC transporter permease [Prauserella oleivorans]|uniref:ABC transporter permease n=1 Tax=Prauserella oleivorans TaxID=1478153 RepID=A0ABW5WEW4_9PSEU